MLVMLEFKINDNMIHRCIKYNSLNIDNLFDTRCKYIIEMNFDLKEVNLSHRF